MKNRTTVITFANAKGGSGKTTSVSALGAGLRARGSSVLFVDLDAQANLTYSLGIESKPLTAMEVLSGTATAEEAIQHTAWGDIIPASASLSIAGSVLTETGREYKLREALEPVKRNYDFVLIDTSPSITILVVNAFVASDKIVIPTLADIFALQGIGAMGQSIETVKKYCNPSLEIAGILFTRYNKRANLSKDIAAMTEQTAELLGTKVFNTVIRECISIREAQAARTDIFSYAPKSNAAADYSNFIDEFLG